MVGVVIKLDSLSQKSGVIASESLDELFLNLENPVGRGIVIPWSTNVGGYELIGISAVFSENSSRRVPQTLIFCPFERRLYTFKNVQRDISWKERYRIGGIKEVLTGAWSEKYIGWSSMPLPSWNPPRDYIREWYRYEGTAEGLVQELQKYAQPL